MDAELIEQQRQGKELERLMKEIKGSDIKVEDPEAAGGAFGAPKVDKEASSKGST